MNFRDLQYLVAIDELKHFHNAAEKCFVSQPTLSGQIKKLEEELGVLLIERNNRQVMMTEVGKRIVKQAKIVLSEANEIKTIAQSFQNPMVGEIKIGLIPTLAPYLLPLIIPMLKKTYPLLQIWLHEHQTAVLLKKLQEGDLDALILALPIDTDEFETIDLFKESFYLAVPANSPLATRSRIKTTDLNAKDILLLEEGHCMRGQALDVCYANGANEFSGYRATSLETLRYMVAEGIGMTLLPELAIPKRTTKSDSIKYIPFANPSPYRRIGLLFRRHTSRKTTMENIAKIIQAILP